MESFGLVLTTWPSQAAAGPTTTGMPAFQRLEFLRTDIEAA